MVSKGKIQESSSSVLPIDNDIRKGGRAKKLTITRCGGMKTAQKDTFPRVYNDDGTYSYPKDQDNILRKKGDEYFENWEIAYHILKDYLEEHPEIDPFIK